MSTLAFFACLFRVDDWEGRGMFISTLLLTTIAFKFVVADCMPKVPEISRWKPGMCTSLTTFNSMHQPYRQSLASL